MHPSPLSHSWPLFETGQRLDLGYDFDWADVPAAAFPADAEALARQGVGIWDCDLADNALTWSAGVYDLFGLPRGVRVDRATSVSLYREASRAAMERLRAYAIKHRRGFTLDVEIAPADGGSTRWLRLSAAPVCIENRPRRLRGMKRDVTGAYRPRRT